MDSPKTSSFARVWNWYARFERPISSISLVGGFVFDAITLKRVDLFWENFWVVAHLAIVALCIIFINLGENKVIDEKDPAKIHFWLINTLQFFFGGLLSTFLVFYFRSGTLAASWPFLLVLVAAFVANESLKKHYARLTFQIGLFFLSLLSFAIFIVPVLLHAIGPVIFLLSGAASLFVLWLFLLILKYVAREKFTASKRPLTILISVIFIGTIVLYFFNFIPPIPLSLKSAGIYHSLFVNSPGNYTVQSEDQGFFGFFKWYEDIHLVSGDSLYAYSAVFSPASLDTAIVHEWQRYDDQAGKWITMGRVNLSVVGGRDGGYRTYSLLTPTVPGLWRVNVDTPRGEIIGRLQFNVILGSIEPALQTVMID